MTTLIRQSIIHLNKQDMKSESVTSPNIALVKYWGKYDD
jgi:mevalonate pyrophosphate decarboxylase